MKCCGAYDAAIGDSNGVTSYRIKKAAPRQEEALCIGVCISCIGETRALAREADSVTESQGKFISSESKAIRAKAILSEQDSSVNKSQRN